MQTLIEQPAIGTQYRKGTLTLIDIKTKPGGDFYGLFLIPDNTSTPYASWFMGNDGTSDMTIKYDGSKYFCYGHYFENLIDAVKDFEDR